MKRLKETPFWAWTIAIGLVLTAALIVWHKSNKYQQYYVEKDHSCLVESRMQSSGSYRQSGRFILVLRDEHYNLFSLDDVDPKTYYLAGKRKYLTFFLSEKKIVEGDNSMDGLTFSLLLGIIVIGIIAPLLSILFKNF